MSHDQLFKDFLREFFREFMELFYPHIAARLDFSRTTLYDKELFTDLPQGRQREADVVAEVYTLDGEPETILLHVEIEGEWGRDFSARMDEYYKMLSLRYRKDIYPIAIFLTGGQGEIVKATHISSPFGEEVNRFTYSTVALSNLSADDYLDSDNPAAFALTPLMQVSKMGRVLQKLWSMRKIARSEQNEARKAVLSNMAETYLTLNDTEQDEYALLVEAEAQEAKQMISVFEERGIEKGIAIGIERGIEQGKEETRQMVSVFEERGIEKGIAIGIERGIEQGKEETRQMVSVFEERGIEKGIAIGIEEGIERGAVRASRDNLLKIMRRKFGELPEIAAARIAAIDSRAKLEALFDRALDAERLDELGLDTTT